MCHLVDLQQEKKDFNKCQILIGVNWMLIKNLD